MEMESLLRYAYLVSADLSSSVTLSWWLLGAAACVLLGLVYYYLLLPMDWTKELCEVGFEVRGGGKSRAALMQDWQRKRRIGKLPPVYPNGWFPVLESCRLPRGQVEYVPALGQNLAVFRTDGGEVRVLDAYCPHMGANMAIGGRVAGDCLECPFHSWQFSGLDGKCISVPYAQKVPDFAKVRCWESRELNSYIFIWHHAEGEAPTWEPQQIPHVDDGAWTFVGRNEFVISCHIQEVPENGADVAHLSTVHAPGMVFPGLSRHVWALDWEPNSEEGLTHTATLRIKHQLALFGKINLFKINVCANQIGPGYVELYVETQLGPIVIVQSLTPVEPLLQKVIHRMYCPPYLLPYAKFVLFGESIMFERDIMVWNHKQYQDKPLLVKEERIISRFRRWYSQFYSENSPKFTFQKDSMEW